MNNKGQTRSHHNGNAKKVHHENTPNFSATQMPCTMQRLIPKKKWKKNPQEYRYSGHVGYVEVKVVRRGRIITLSARLEPWSNAILTPMGYQRLDRHMVAVVASVVYAGLVL